MDERRTSFSHNALQSYNTEEKKWEEGVGEDAMGGGVGDTGDGGGVGKWG